MDVRFSNCEVIGLSNYKTYNFEENAKKWNDEKSPPVLPACDCATNLYLIAIIRRYL